MKRLILAVALLLAILAGSTVNAHRARDLTDRLTGRLRQAQRLAQTGQWDQARAFAAQAASDWEDQWVFRSVLLSHSQADQIGGALDRVLEELDCRDYPAYAADAAQLMAQLHALSDLEQLSIGNIL